MKRSELNFNFPESLVATKPLRPSRVMWVKNKNPLELQWKSFLEKFRPGDVLVVNDTKVTPLRVWAKSSHGDKTEEADLLFLKPQTETLWEVLAPTKKMKGQRWTLPEDIEVLEWSQGLPQRVQLSRALAPNYFEKYGEMPLPPYILKARGNRHSENLDRVWYQTVLAENEGSQAAPTASLHFSKEDFLYLQSRGVEIAPLTLHVGLGTFLPVTVVDLNEHPMHKEKVTIPKETWRKVGRCSGRVWALGTTVARSLESAVIGKLEKSGDGFVGETDLLITPGYDFKIVRGLLTNFHQPESTLLALVAAFSGLENLKACYQWAIEHKFRLFSYGDLSAWEM